MPPLSPTLKAAEDCRSPKPAGVLDAEMFPQRLGRQGTPALRPRAVEEKGVGNVFVAEVRGKGQRRHAEMIALIDVGTVSEKKLHEAIISVFDGDIQWGHPVARFGVDLSLVVEKQTRDINVTLLSGHMQ